MKIIKLTLSSILLSLPLLACSAVNETSTTAEKGWRHGDGLTNLASELNLNAEQQAKLDSLVKEHKEEFNARRGHWRHRHDEHGDWEHAHQFRHLESELGLSEEQKNQVASIHQGLAEKIKALHAESQKSFAAVLTPEQLTKFQALQKEHEEHRTKGDRWGKR
jgi:Spy/CpxP family protein refolding chaperone